MLLASNSLVVGPCLHRPGWNAGRNVQRVCRHAIAEPEVASPSGLTSLANTQQPSAPGFLHPDLPPVTPWNRPEKETYTKPSIRDSGTLRPGPEWYPAWMKYKQREDNYVFWQEKFLRCSLEVPGTL